MALKASKRGAISPFIVMDVMRAADERAAAGSDVLHLEVGQPGTPAPAAVRAQAKAALDRERLGYTDAFGIEPLRRRIARHYREEYGVDVDWRQVAITTGSSGGFLLAFLAAFNAGDRVALASPGYPAYRNILRALDIEAIELPVGPQTHFQPTPALLEEVPCSLDGLIVASPANPTGTMLDRKALAALAETCRRKGIRLVSDEIYHGIVYRDAGVTALALDAEAIVVNSFSKYYSMTGWRLGWLIVPKALVRSIECLAQNLFISPPALSQYAATAAFDCRDELDGNVARYGRNRALLLEELPKAGFPAFAPADGAFYLYADVSHRTDDSQHFCTQILHDVGLAITPGIDFDPARGHRFVRFSFAGPTADMVEAARRLKAWRSGPSS